jgi:hypothetical protein
LLPSASRPVRAALRMKQMARVQVANNRRQVALEGGPDARLARAKVVIDSSIPAIARSACTCVSHGWGACVVRATDTHQGLLYQATAHATAYWQHHDQHFKAPPLTLVTARSPAFKRGVGCKRLDCWIRGSGARLTGVVSAVEVQPAICSGWRLETTGTIRCHPLQAVPARRGGGGG